MAVKFTQYILPDGTKKPVEIDLGPEIETLANDIIQAGFVFEIEILSNGMVSATISDDEADHAHSITPNGPQVPEGIISMIRKFHDAQIKNGGTDQRR